MSGIDRDMYMPLGRLWYNDPEYVVPVLGSTALEQYTSSPSPKGQITIPAEVRREMGLKSKDRVAICVEGDQVTLAPARSVLDRMYQSVPALRPPRSWREITEIAEDAAREGLRER